MPVTYTPSHPLNSFPPFSLPLSSNALLHPHTHSCHSPNYQSDIPCRCSRCRASTCRGAHRRGHHARARVHCRPSRCGDRHNRTGRTGHSDGGGHRADTRGAASECGGNAQGRGADAADAADTALSILKRRDALASRGSGRRERAVAQEWS